MGKKRTIYGYIAITIVGIVISVGGGISISISDKITSDWDEPWPTIAEWGSVAVFWFGIGVLVVGIAIMAIGGIGIYKNH